MAALLDGLRGLWYRVSTRVRRAPLERELTEEMRFHRELLARDLEQRGVPAADAESAARRKFGNPLALRERSAESWGFPRLEGVLQDVRFGTRMLRKSPGFTLVAVVAIGLGIGINSGFFTLFDALMLQPLPVANPSRLVRFITVDARGVENVRFSYPEYTAVASHAATVEDVVAYDAELAALRVPSSGAVAATVSVGCVSGNYFSALGGSATLGRTLLPSDNREGAAPVVVLNDLVWRRDFARSPDIVGRDVVVDGAHVTIVGVVRADFIGINPLVPDVWMPLTLAGQIGVTPGQLSSATNRFIPLHARLRAGIPRPRAEAELSGMVREPTAAPGTRAELTRITAVRLMPMSSAVPLTGEAAVVAVPWLVLGALVLVIACANLANLLLSRALIRQREIAVRLALGASRHRLLRQLLTESLLIALLGAALGLLLANWTVTATSRSLFAHLPLVLGTLALSLHPSWRVLAFTVGLALLSVLTFGLAPALQATLPNLTAALKGEDTLFGTRIRRSRFRDWLVAGQVAACVVLLVAAGTLVQSLRDIAGIDTGLVARGVTVAHVGLSAEGHVAPSLAASRARMSAAVAALPGVVATARAAQAPFWSWPVLHVANVGDRGPLRALPYNVVTPRYFEVVGQRLIDGRAFSADDSSTNALVAIVTTTAARALWPGKPAIGQSLRVAGAAGADSADRIYRIIGTVSDAHSARAWDWDGAGYIYLPASATDIATHEMPLLIRADASVRDLSRSLGDIARHVDPNAPLHVDRLTDLYAVQLVPFQYAALIAGGVGALGLVLAVTGLYAVVAFAVTQRRREIAVHIAMGAAPRDVLRLVLRREMRLVLVGLEIGLVLSAGEAQLLGSFVNTPVSRLGAIGFIGMPVFLLIVAMAATIVPALAALRIAPIQVLRQD